MSGKVKSFTFMNDGKYKIYLTFDGNDFSAFSGKYPEFFKPVIDPSQDIRYKILNDVVYDLCKSQTNVSLYFEKTLKISGQISAWLFTATTRNGSCHLRPSRLLGSSGPRFLIEYHGGEFTFSVAPIIGEQIASNYQLPGRRSRIKIICVNEEDVENRSRELKVKPRRQSTSGDVEELDEESILENSEEFLQTDDLVDDLFIDKSLPTTDDEVLPMREDEYHDEF